MSSPWSISSEWEARPRQGHEGVDRNACAPTSWIGPHLEASGRLRTEPNGHQWCERIAILARTPYLEIVQEALYWPQPAGYHRYRWAEPQPGVDISDIETPPDAGPWGMEELPSEEALGGILAAQAPVVALIRTRIDAAHAALISQQEKAKQERLAALKLADRLAEQARTAKNAEARMLYVQSLLVAEADGCVEAHEALRGRYGWNGHEHGLLKAATIPTAESEAALAAFGGVVPTDDDGRPVCKDAYERALWGFITRLAAEFPEGIPLPPDSSEWSMNGVAPMNQMDKALYATPALALDRAKLGKWKGPWCWAQVAAIAEGVHPTRRCAAEWYAAGWRPLSKDLGARARRVLALR